MPSTVRNAWSRWLRVSKPYFTSEVRWQAAGLLAVLLALLLALSGLNVVNSYVGRHFMTAITERAPERYAWLALAYLGVFAASTVVGGFQRYTELCLGLRWREWLTRHLIHRYLSDHAYCRINRKVASTTTRCWRSAKTAPGGRRNSGRDGRCRPVISSSPGGLPSPAWGKATTEGTGPWVPCNAVSD
jgi:putative ATP-binding cassette transporter